MKLSKEVTNTEQERLDVNERLTGYIHEALRSSISHISLNAWSLKPRNAGISQPLTLWRSAVEGDTIAASGSQITVQKGDVIFADLHKLHNMVNPLTMFTL